MPKSVYRYEVPIDDAPHSFELTGFPIATAAVLNGVPGPYLEFWAEHRPGNKTMKIEFQVYGTGHKIPDHAVYQGTAPRSLGLVFHLYELSVEY